MLMSRIEVEPKYRCDRCGVGFAASNHHGWLVIREGFGDVKADGHAACVMDLCDSCLREVRKCASRQTEIEY
jgi:hypothetical protein